MKIWSFEAREGEGEFFLCREWQPYDGTTRGIRFQSKVWFGSKEDEVLCRRFLDLINILEEKAQGIEYKDLEAK